MALRRVVGKTNMSGMLQLVVDDITRLAVDAVVNAANTRLAGGGGVDGAIHRAAGPELKRACAEIGGCPTGEARITPGFELPASWVIHTAGPVWNGGEKDEPVLLKSCYQSSLKLAREYEIESIAFPCISTGVYGFPGDLAAEIALAIMDSERDHFERLVVCCFSDADASEYRQAADKLQVDLD